MAESLLKTELSRAACGKNQELQCRKTETAVTRAMADVGWNNEKVSLETWAKGKNPEDGAENINEKQEEFYMLICLKAGIQNQDNRRTRNLAEQAKKWRRYLRWQNALLPAKDEN